MSNFDRDFNRMQGCTYIVVAFQLFFIVAVFGFIGWVIVQLMQYFGVLQ